LVQRADGVLELGERCFLARAKEGGIGGEELEALDGFALPAHRLESDGAGVLPVGAFGGQGGGADDNACTIHAREPLEP
jgi:hypothetical protein